MTTKDPRFPQTNLPGKDFTGETPLDDAGLVPDQAVDPDPQTTDPTDQNSTVEAIELEDEDLLLPDPPIDAFPDE